MRNQLLHLFAQKTVVLPDFLVPRRSNLMSNLAFFEFNNFSGCHVSILSLRSSVRGKYPPAAIIFSINFRNSGSMVIKFFSPESPVITATEKSLLNSAIFPPELFLILPNCFSATLEIGDREEEFSEFAGSNFSCLNSVNQIGLLQV